MEHPTTNGTTDVNGPGMPEKRSLWFRLVLGTHPKRTLVRAVLIGLVVFCIANYWLRPAYVDGHSMDPTIRDNQMHILNLLTYHSRDPQRFDIVAIHGAGNGSLFLKRILGLPGETVEWKIGRLFIDGVEIEEPYLVGSNDWVMPRERLGEDEYFVAGDNRGISIQSHVVGVTQRRSIYAKLVW